MLLNYADMMAVVESIRQKTDNPEFTKLERDTLLFALGLLSARAPGKLEPSKAELDKVEQPLPHTSSARHAGAGYVVGGGGAGYVGSGGGSSAHYNSIGAVRR